MTPPFTTIACCIDDSAASHAALAEAARLRGREGRLLVVHVVSSPHVVIGTPGAICVPDGDARIEAARAWLDERVAQVAPAEPVLLLGDPPAAAVEWAREARPDLMVAAAHHGILGRMLLGSFASRLARHAPCPVLLVRPIEAGGGADARAATALRAG
jgi:nucleotide-binding universal stress UspA family protein